MSPHGLEDRIVAADDAADPLAPSDLAGVEWHRLTPAEALARLRASEEGLAEAAVRARRASFGANVLPRRRRSGPIAIYLRQFKNPLIYLLLAATVVSLAMAEWTDALFIFVVIQLNAVIGAYQERRAESSAAALDELVRNAVVVERAGLAREVDAAELVPGDLVRLASGARVPADLRLIAANEIVVDESLLTGESTPVEKSVEAMARDAAPLADRRNMLYAGTMVLAGRSRGVVAATGATTEVGRIAEAIGAGEGAPPPLVRRLERFSRVVGIATVALIGLIAAVQLAQGLPLVTVFLVAVALAVAAIPEGLPVAITVALAIATTRMARRNVIVRALPAVEGLGACTLIASDKTGTLTVNELTVRRVMLFDADASPTPVAVGGEGYRPQGRATVDGRAPTVAEEGRLRALAATGVLCNEARLRIGEDGVEHLGDTVDVAFLVLAVKLGLAPETLRAEQHPVGLLPYEPQHRFAATFTRSADGSDGPGATAHVKGAAEVIVPMCEGIDRGAVLAQADALAAEGYRVLAAARGPIAATAGRESLRGLTLLGLVGLIDPVRPEVPEAVARCRRAGVDVRMVTGDHPSTALAIARTLGIAEQAGEVVTGRDLARCQADGDRFAERVRQARVFARIEPVQKLAIVRALQADGHVVAVSGDGVNDAPALLAGDIGIAMGRGGTDAARGASDLILADDNFASIVSGIEEGRIAYANVRKLVYLLITTGLGEIVLFMLAIAFGLPLPLFAVQLLWLNLVTNGIQDVALAFERGEPGVLERKPRPPDENIFERRMVVQIAVAGVYMGLCAFAFYAWSLARGLDEATARNLLLLLMVLFENVHALNARSETRSVFRVPFAANPFLIVAVVAAQAVHIGAMYTPWLGAVLDVQPIAWHDWLTVAAIAASLLAVMEIYKRAFALRIGDAGA